MEHLNCIVSVPIIAAQLKVLERNELVLNHDVEDNCPDPETTSCGPTWNSADRVDNLPLPTQVADRFNAPVTTTRG